MQIVMFKKLGFKKQVGIQNFRKIMNKKSLKFLSEQVWIGEYMHGKKPLLFNIRMTVIRLSTGGLWIHSPIPIDALVADELAQLGAVEHIIAPNCFHHSYVAQAKQRYPNAKLWAAPGLRKKRSDIVFDAELNIDIPEWKDDIELEYISGMSKINEIVFFHVLSRSLICSDFVLNIWNEPSRFMRILWRLAGVWRNFGQSRTWRFMIKDYTEQARAIDKVLAWDFSRIIMAHGDIIDCGYQQLCEALSSKRK